MNMRRFLTWSILTVFLAGCGSVSGQLQVFSPAGATAMVKESEDHIQESPTLTSTVGQTFPTQTPSPTPEASVETTLIPSPETAVTSWEQLIVPNLVVNMNWTLYTGQLEGEGKGNLRTFSLSYPNQWVVTLNPNPVHFSVQNVPESVGVGPVAGDFVKLEVVPLKGSLPENGEGEKYIVRIAGEMATLRMNATSPGRSLQIWVTLEKDGIYYILAGYVNLAKEDQATLDRYQAILLSMLASFQME